MLDKLTKADVNKIKEQIRPALDYIEKQYGMKISIPHVEFSDVSATFVIQGILSNPEVEKRREEDRRAVYEDYANSCGYNADTFNKQFSYKNSDGVPELYRVYGIDVNRYLDKNTHYIQVQRLSDNELFHISPADFKHIEFLEEKVF